jgi:hypothetical protein
MNNRNENDEQNFQYFLYRFASHFSFNWIWISIQFQFECNSNQFNLTKLNPIPMDFNSIQCFEFNWVELELNWTWIEIDYIWIQFKWYAISFHIFIQMESICIIMKISSLVVHGSAASMFWNLLRGKRFFLKKTWLTISGLLYNPFYFWWILATRWLRKIQCEWYKALFWKTNAPKSLDDFQGICFAEIPILITLSFTPSPLFQWYTQSEEILLSLSMKCWNSEFNGQGSRLIIVIVLVGVTKIYVTAVKRLRIKGKTDRMKLSLPPKLVEKLVWVSVISFCKIFIPSSGFDALLCRSWSFSHTCGQLKKKSSKIR